MQIGHQRGLDDTLVSEILTAAKAQHVCTTVHFGRFVRPYLAAGFPREVAEAHRQYFEAQGRGEARSVQSMLGGSCDEADDQANPARDCRAA